MGSALDEAERALVTGSWSKASDAAATARRVARTAPDRVAAESVWVQAEYKLGRLGETHEADARRITGVGGDSLEPQTLLLWSRLKLADVPRGQPETRKDDRASRRAEASASDALAGVFREAFRRRLEAQGGGSADPSATRVEDDERARDAFDPDATITATVSAAAWLYCVDILCARRRDPRAAADWLRANFASLASPARERLADVVAAAARARPEEAAEEDAEDAAPSPSSTTERREDARSLASHVSPEDPCASFRGGDERRGARETGASPASRARWATARATVDAALGAIVETANASFGVSFDPATGAARMGAAAAAAAAVVVAYAVVAETTRVRTGHVSRGTKAPPRR